MRLSALSAALILLGCATVLSTAQAANQTSSLQAGVDAIQSMGGCYVVDYSYAETESLKSGYTRDGRVYDVNADKTIKEWIYVDQISPTRLRVQHVMFGVDLAGNVMEGSQLKHTGEDWEFQAPFLYDFTQPNTWDVRQGTPAGTWTRRVTNLDDGPRYQCAAPWSTDKVNPEWSCSGYSPIPGRETRDMGRRDYDALDRMTRVISYGDSFIERQANTKVIHRGGVRENLAKEVGKNWYVRLPDSDCKPALDFIAPRRAFWDLVRETWDEVLTGDRAFIEKPAAPGRPSRYFLIQGVEEKAIRENLSDKAVRAGYKQQVLKLINDFRAN